MRPSGGETPTPWYNLVTGKGRRRNSRQTAFLGLAAPILLVFLNVYAPAAPTVTERVLASLIITVAAVPLFIWLSGREPGGPFLAFWGLLYAAYYGMPVFLLARFSRAYYLGDAIADQDIERALLLALVGMVVLLVGYYGPFHRLLASGLPRVEMRWGGRAIQRGVTGATMAAVGLGAYVIATATPVPVVLQGPLVFVGDLSLLATFYLFLLQLVGVRRQIGGIAFLWCVLIPGRFILGVSTGLSYQGLLVLGALILTYVVARRRVPVMWLVLGVATFVVLGGVQVPLRKMTWVDGRSAAGLSQRISMMLEIAGSSAGDPDFWNEAWKVRLSRISHIMTFAEVVRLTPDYVPYWKGETYWPIVWKLVPRLIYPDKPMEVSGQEFGHRYGFLDPADFVTSYNLPQLVEFYANFGWAGVLGGMLVLGVFYRLVQGMFVHPRMGLGATVGVLYLSLKLLVIESSLSGVVGGVAQAVVFLWMVDKGLSIFTLKGGREEGRVRWAVRYRWGG